MTQQQATSYLTFCCTCRYRHTHNSVVRNIVLGTINRMNALLLLKTYIQIVYMMAVIKAQDANSVVHHKPL